MTASGTVCFSAFTPKDVVCKSFARFGWLPHHADLLCRHRQSISCRERHPNQSLPIRNQSGGCESFLHRTIAMLRRVGFQPEPACSSSAVAMACCSASRAVSTLSKSSLICASCNAICLRICVFSRFSFFVSSAIAGLRCYEFWTVFFCAISLSDVIPRRQPMCFLQTRQCHSRINELSVGSLVSFFPQAVQDVADNWRDDLLEAGRVQQVVEVGNRWLCETVLVIDQFDDLLAKQSHFDQCTGRIRMSVSFCESTKRCQYWLCFEKKLEVNRLCQFRNS